MTSTDPIIQVRGLRKSYKKLEVLKGVSFDVYRGGVTTLIGPSGCGKSTCLRCINTLETINGGEVIFAGKTIDYKNHGMRRYVRQRVGMVFQSFNLFPHLTVAENIIIGPRKVLGMQHQKALQRAHELLERFDLAEKKNAMPDELSGGQQQRVAIIRALAMNPEVLLLDEITSALDPELTSEVLALVKQLADEGVTMILVSHAINFVKRIAKEIIFLENGVIVEKGPPEKVLSSPNDRVQKFLATVSD